MPCMESQFKNYVRYHCDLADLGSFDVIVEVITEGLDMGDDLFPPLFSQMSGEKDLEESVKAASRMFGATNQM